MSLGWIAAGVLACLFGLIALLPDFDGNWEPSNLPHQPHQPQLANKKDPGQRPRRGYRADKS